MKRTILSASALFLSLALVASCSKPQKKEKNVIQQSIETPVVQMAEIQKDAAPLGKAPEIAAGSPSAVPASPSSAAATVTKEPATSSSPASQTVVKSAANIMLLIDASGSMNGPIGATTKIDAIKSAIKDSLSTPLMPQAPARKIGLRLFGAGSPADKNDCHDVKLLMPLGKLDIDAMKASLESITPQGTSPMAFAIEDVNNDFKESSESVDNQLIIIADSLDSCNGDIVAAIARLHETKKAIVDIVGFDVDQTVQETLKKAASAGSGTFYLARNASELSSAVDQALSANLPYNLRVKVMSGATPLASTITIYRANTQSIVDRAESAGIKFFKLTPGSYDIRVDYLSSLEKTKPSKIIKGVEVTGTTKTEQVIHFDLGAVNITAVNQNGKETTANFYIRKSGAEDIIGTLLNVPSPQMIYLTPGTYDIDAETAEEGTATLSAQIKNVEIKDGETTEQTIKFQTGQLVLKAQNITKTAVPITYRITKPGSIDVVASGSGPIDGITIDLAPGKYDVYVAWTDPNIQGSPEVKLSDITINGGESLEQLATIVTGTLKLSGKDSQGNLVHTEFVIKKAGDPAEIAKAVSDAAPIELFVAPDAYDITAVNTTSKVIPAPSVLWEKVTVKEGETVTEEAVFKLGQIKLIGKNAKQQIMQATFTIYRSGTDEPLVTETAQSDWITFSLTPGMYDIKAEETDANSDPKPSVWFHDVIIKEGDNLQNEAVFTSGKLKLICMGKNNTILTCEFNLFTYGSDTALFSGKTTDEWKEFDIPPGKYYMEAGWHDPKEEQFLKKWINIEVSENEIVEEVLRF